MTTELESLFKMMGSVLASKLAPDQMERLMKDTMPAGGRPVNGRLYDGGPFSLINEDIYSLNIGNSSEFTQWMDTEAVDYKIDEVQHITWGAVPYGFDGSQTYADWLSTITIDTCGYGPSGVNWDGFTYRVEGGSFSFTSDMMTVIEDSGIKLYQKQPLYNIRGGNGPISGVISSDKDWAIAQLLDVARRHVDYINLYGEKLNSDMEWDGIHTIITPGYVGARVVGPSASAAYADPLWFNGAALGAPANPATVLKLINTMVKNRRKFAASRNWTINPADEILLMHPDQLELLQESLAQGGLPYYNNLFGSAGQLTLTLGEYEARLTRFRESNMLQLSGRSIRVITDINIGHESVIDDTTDGTGHTGDIFYLVKRVNGMTVLSNKFLDWNKLDYPFKGTDRMAEIQGGIARTGWVEEASKCYYYFLEMYGRMVCTFMPMQGRISNVTMARHDAADLVEQTAFWAPNYAGFNGEMGGTGVQRLFGQRT